MECVHRGNCHVVRGVRRLLAHLASVTDGFHGGQLAREAARWASAGREDLCVCGRVGGQPLLDHSRTSDDG